MPPIFTKSVTCGSTGCQELAEYKIAAPWSVGRFSELKTYGLACQTHYAGSFRDAVRRRKIHPPSQEELQGDMAVYQFEKGKAAAKGSVVPNPE